MSGVRLIVNADDFGLSEGVNRGIVEAHERGIVTSTSLMVRRAAAEHAASLAAACRHLGVGLHVDLGEWVFEDGDWRAVYVHGTGDAASVAAEVDAQLATFAALLDRYPTHLDSHQHVHCDEPARSVLAERAAALAIPLRHLAPDVRYCGDFYGQTAQGTRLPDRVTTEALLRILSAIEPGTTELACHPGHAEGLDSRYAREREAELAALCDERVHQHIAELEIELCTFAVVESRNAASVASRAP